MRVRDLRSGLAAACGVALVGCAAVPVADTPRSLLERPGVAPTVAVVPARYAPQAILDTYARGAAEGASKGAAKGTLAGVGLLLQLIAAAGPAAIVVAPIAGAALAGAAVAGLAAGAATGAAQATPEAQAEAIERVANAIAGELALPDAIAAVVARETPGLAGYRTDVVAGLGPVVAGEEPDYRALGSRGFGGVVEVAVPALGFTAAAGEDPDLTLFVAVSARLVDPATGSADRLRGMVYLSSPHRMAAWTGDDAALAKRELRRAVAALGARIVDDLLLQAVPAAGLDVPRLPASCGNTPLQPQAAWTAALFGPARPIAAEVPSTTPLLAWEALPTPTARWPAEPWERTRDHRYDLRIWADRGGAPDLLVYERSGLAQPRHQVEVPLAPGAQYFWSVRMRWSFDGHPRASRWSASNSPALQATPAILGRMFHSRVETGRAVRQSCEPVELEPCGCLDFIPTPNHYRFRTPVQ